MGCGKSKHDVASGNTVLQHKKSSVCSNKSSGQENGTETKDKNSNNVVANVSSGVEVEQIKSKDVKKVGDEGKADECKCNDVKDTEEIANVEGENTLEKSKEGDRSEGRTQEIVVAEGFSEKSESGKDDSLKENDQKANDSDAEGAAEEKRPDGNEEDVSVKEETLANEENMKDTNVSTTEGEEKDFKAEEGR